MEIRAIKKIKEFFEKTYLIYIREMIIYCDIIFIECMTAGKMHWMIHKDHIKKLGGNHHGNIA